MVNYKGYCMGCKDTREMKDCSVYKMGKKKDRDAVRGVCTKCGTKMNKIMSKEDKARLGK